MFFSSHVLSEVDKVCDRIGIIRNGELVALEDIENLKSKMGKKIKEKKITILHMAAIPILGNEKIMIFPVESFFISLKLFNLSELDCS